MALMEWSWIEVPYHLGQADVGPGRGPATLRKTMLPGLLPRPRHRTTVRTTERRMGNEVARSFDVLRATRDAVERSVRSTALPVVVSGNCNAIVGALAGIPQGLGLLYFDAHGDLNTPETTTSGYFEGMPLAVQLGRCWKNMASTIPGFRPTAEGHVVHLASRDLDPPEKAFLRKSKVTLVDAASMRSDKGKAALRRAVRRIAREVDGFYVHFDVDAMDTRDGVPAHNAIGGGPTLKQLTEAVEMAAKHAPIRGIGVASYNPEYDRDGKAARSISRWFRDVLPTDLGVGTA